MAGAGSVVLVCREPQVASGSIQREPRGEPRGGSTAALQKVEEFGHVVRDEPLTVLARWDRLRATETDEA